MPGLPGWQLYLRERDGAPIGEALLRTPIDGVTALEWTTAPRHHPRSTRGHRPDLVHRNFQPDPAGLDTRWCGDITYVATDEDWLYLATVIDVAS
ncbi:hypothetical protein [Streptomyces sp. NPDC053431]|uniref:hypothetical protein n=1 Tax=Streptomyces sp. NPDC053431 TaxID=3365703 RepID=UPI0037D4CD65